MIQLGARRADHTPAPRARAQAKVEIVVGDREMLGFQPAHCLEHRATQGHAGTGHRRDTARLAQHPAMPRIIACGTTAKMRGDRARTDRHASVLQRPVRIQQPRADDADVRLLRQHDHLVQPRRVDDIDIVVEQHNDFAACMADAGVVHGRPVERPGMRQDAHAWVGSQACQQARGAAFPAVVVHDEQLDRLVIGAVQNPLDAAGKQRGTVAGGDNDGDEWYVPGYPC